MAANIRLLLLHGGCVTELLKYFIQNSGIEMYLRANLLLVFLLPLQHSDFSVQSQEYYDIFCMSGHTIHRLQET